MATMGETPVYINPVTLGRVYDNTTYTEPAAERRPVDTRNIWNDVDQIPTTPPTQTPFPGTTVAVVSGISGVVLTEDPGTPGSFVSLAGEFLNMVPAGIDNDMSQYQPTLRDAGGKVIPYDPSVWVADGLLQRISFANLDDYPSGPLTIDYWRYVGGTGGSGSGVTTTLTSLGPADEPLVVDGVGPSLTVKGLSAGVGITLASDGTQVTIGNSGSAPTGAAGGSLSGTYPNPTIAAGAVGATELAATTVTAASYGSATEVATFTVDADGRLTAAGNTTIAGVAPGGAAGGSLAGTYPNPTIAAGAVGATELAATTVTAAAYGSATEVATFTVDADGRLTVAASTPIDFSSAGDVDGPASATDNALVRFDGATGKLVQNSTATLTDAGDLVIQGTTESTSIATGSIVTAGGAGIAKNVFVGGSLNVDTISERTAAAGVTIDSVLCKDASISFDGGTNSFASIIEPTTTWVPALSLPFNLGGTGAIFGDAYYCRYGRLVTATMQIRGYTETSPGGTTLTVSIPFPSIGTSVNGPCGHATVSSSVDLLPKIARVGVRGTTGVLLNWDAVVGDGSTEIYIYLYISYMTAA